MIAVYMKIKSIAYLRLISRNTRYFNMECVHDNVVDVASRHETCFLIHSQNTIKISLDYNTYVIDKKSYTYQTRMGESVELFISTYSYIYLYKMIYNIKSNNNNI